MRVPFVTSSIALSAIYLTPASATSILAFGAQCDAVTDDSTAILAAAACATPGGSCGSTGLTPGDGVVQFPDNGGCLFATGSLVLGDGNNDHVVLLGGPLPSPGSTSGTFTRLSSPTLGSTFIAGPGVSVQMLGNTGVSDMAFVSAGLYNTTLSVSSESTSSVFLTLATALSYTANFAVPIAAGSSPGCLPADTAASFVAGSNRLTLSTNGTLVRPTCTTDTSVVLGYKRAADITQYKQMLASLTENTAPFVELTAASDITVQDVVMIGAATCISASNGTILVNTPRLLLEDLALDCTNGVKIGDTSDQSEIHNLHMRDYLNVNSVTSATGSGTAAISTVTTFTEYGSGTIGVFTDTKLDPGITAGDLVTIIKAGTYPNSNAPLGYPEFDGKFTIGSISSGGTASTMSSLTLLGLTTNPNLIVQPTTTANWSESGSLVILSSPGTLLLDNNIQGTALFYQGATSLSAPGSSGMHIENVTSGGWNIGAYISNVDHVYFDDLACSDNSSTDPYSVCLVLDQRVDAFNLTNLGIESYSIGILNTSQSALGGGNANANSVANVSFSPSPTGSYSLVQAGAALTLTNFNSTHDSQQGNILVTDAWPSTCADVARISAGTTIACPNSGATFSAGNLVVSGGQLYGVGFAVGASNDLQKIVLGSGTQEQLTPNRGFLLPAPWNDRQTAITSISATASVTTTAVLGTGIKELLVTAVSAGGTIAVTLPPNPSNGDTLCTSANLTTSTTWTGSVVGFPSALGGALPYSFCATWTGSVWAAN